MNTYESLSCVGAHSKLTIPKKRWLKKEKARSVRAHGKAFVKAWKTWQNPSEDCHFAYQPNRKKGYAD